MMDAQTRHCCGEPDYSKDHFTKTYRENNMTTYPFTFDDPSSAMRAALLLRRLKQRHNLGLDQILTHGRLRWSRMKLSRFIDRATPLTAAEFSRLAPLVAAYAPCSVDDVWKAVRPDGTDHELLSELIACTFWRSTAADMAALAGEFTAALRPPACWTYAGRTLPAWLYPIGPRLRCINSLAASVGILDKSTLEIWHKFFRDVSLAVMPIDEVLPINGVILAFTAHYDRSASGQWPHDRFAAEHLADFSSSLLHDVVRNRGTCVGFICDNAAPEGDPLRNAIERLDSLVIVDDKFLLKRDAGSAVWATCRRTGDPGRDTFFNRHALLLRQLGRRVCNTL
jgi:hypothetical protein